ncbi:MAG: GspMb/PilO family protein [Pyrinomonadaceae bacterium]
MSQEQPMPNPAVAARRPRQISIAKLRTAPGLSLIGLPELIGLAGAVLIALLTIFAYFYFYLPAQSRLTTLQLERDRLQAFLRTSQSNLQQNTTVRQQVDKITSSMSDFERNWLPNPSSGRMSLYATVNDLIKSNGLRNTAGPTYTPLEPIGSKGQVAATTSAEKQTSAKWQTIYPGIAVSVTVEGPYQRVRRFVREIESSRQFLIINEVELESVTQSGIASEPSTAGGATGGRATLVSLRLEMATYFHRPEVVSAQ